MLIGGAGMTPLTAMPASPAPLPMLPVLLPLIGPGMTVPPAPRGTRGALHRHTQSLALSPGGCWQFFWFLPGLHRGGWVVFDGLVGRGGAAAGKGALLAAPPFPDPYPVLLVRLSCSIHKFSGSPWAGNLSQAILSGQENPYCCINGAQPARALSQTLLQAGRGLVYSGKHIGVYIEQRKNFKSGEHLISTNGQN